MRLGLGSYTYRWSIGSGDELPERPMTPFDLLDAAERFGFDVLQIADNMPLEPLSESDLQRLAAAAREKGIILEAGTQCFDAAQVARYLGICRVLDARILRIALDVADSRIPVADLAAQLRPLVSEAADSGIRIAIENHFNYPSPMMVQLLDTVDDPALGICLDVANSICAREWPEQTVTMLAPYTINLHLKDYTINPDPNGVGFRISGVPLGEGLTDIQWVLDQLTHCPPDMSVILEHWLPKEGGLAATMAQEEVWLQKSLATARRYVTAA